MSAKKQSKNKPGRKKAPKPLVYQWSSLLHRQKKSISKKAKKSGLRKQSLPRFNLSGQHFWVLVACFIVAILSLQQLRHSPTKLFINGPTETNFHVLSSSTEDVKPKAKPASQPLNPAPIIAWRGPVQPMALAPSPIPVITTVPTTEPVVFVTIDDGWVQMPEIHEWLVQHHLPFSLFLTDAGIRNNYQYFQDLQNAGMTIENHTINHPRLTKLNHDAQTTEICGAADIFQSVFHKRPSLFRPPYGVYGNIATAAAQGCGQKAIVMWRVVVENGALQYQDQNTGLMPGDIVLTHFQPDFLANMQALAAELDKQHLQVGHLEDWLH